MVAVAAEGAAPPDEQAASARTANSKTNVVKDFVFIIYLTFETDFLYS
jgi:hypothetical protein